MEHLKEILIEQPRVRVGMAGQYASMTHTFGVWVGGVSRGVDRDGKEWCNQTMNCFMMTRSDMTKLRAWLMAKRDGSQFEPTPDLTPRRPYWWLPEGMDSEGRLNISEHPKRDGANWRLQLDSGDVALHTFAFQTNWIVRARFQLEALQQAVRAHLDQTRTLTKT